LGNLRTLEVVEEARLVREASFPFTQEGLMKATVVTLKAVLEARGLDSSGSRKADLVQRLLSAASVWSEMVLS